MTLSHEINKRKLDEIERLVKDLKDTVEGEKEISLKEIYLIELYDIAFKIVDVVNNNTFRNIPEFIDNIDGYKLTERILIRVLSRSDRSFYIFQLLKKLTCMGYRIETTYGFLGEDGLWLIKEGS
jgi:hypothetical protein